MKKIHLPILIAVFAVLPCSNLFSQENKKLIEDYISQNKIREYKKSDLTNFTIENVDDSKSLQGNVVKFQQTYHGYPVFNSAGTALIKDKKIVYYTDNFVKSYDRSNSENTGIDKYAAFQKAASDVGLNAADYKIINFDSPELENEQSAKQRIVYYKDKENLVLAYEFMFSEKEGSNYWDILVDANTGEVVNKINLNLSCEFSEGTYLRGTSQLLPTVENNNPEDIQKKVNSVLLTPDNATYNVFAPPIEAPGFGNRSIVSNPWDLTASPEGWHSDGTNHYTITRGNNVFAYTDLNSTNTVGTSANGGASRNFDFPLDINQPFSTYENAAITNLFYMNNKMHDIFHKFGFNESARNFQMNNFGNGGTGNDAVNAEARDGGNLLDNDHLNNANFATPMDGTKPRMQMYLWNPKVVNRLFYNSPATFVPRLPPTTNAVFGPALTITGITGELALSTPANACTAVPVGSLTGKIAVVTATGCNFTVKTKNLQNAGAVAVIQYHPSSDTPVTLGGADPTIIIPTIMIGKTEGLFLVDQITAGTAVNATLKDDKSSYIYIDADLDNGIIAHEYGHGISNRNTGDGYTCLNANVDNEQMGEGWSDFFALMLTNQPGDNASTPRGMGTFAAGQATIGSGIRPARYSPDFSINNYTYTKTNGLTTINNLGQTVPHSHSIGFIWATMLWDLHWQYVAKYGYSSDVTANTTSGSARVLQLIVNGLKLQGCSPSFIAGRDAIIAADQAATGGADKCMIWKTFAKRGLGVNANPGSITPANLTAAAVTAAISDQTEDFTVPAECLLATDEVKAVKNTISIYPNPAKNEFFINFPSNTLGKVSVEIYDMSGKLVSSEDKISPDAKKAISTDKLVDGTYMVKVKGLAIDANSKVIVKK
jgi:hypothetical protein